MLLQEQSRNKQTVHKQLKARMFVQLWRQQKLMLVLRLLNIRARRLKYLLLLLHLIRQSPRFEVPPLLELEQ